MSSRRQQFELKFEVEIFYSLDNYYPWGDPWWGPGPVQRGPGPGQSSPGRGCLLRRTGNWPRYSEVGHSLHLHTMMASQQPGGGQGRGHQGPELWRTWQHQQCPPVTWSSWRHGVGRPQPGWEWSEMLQPNICCGYFHTCISSTLKLIFGGPMIVNWLILLRWEYLYAYAMLW